MYKPFHEKEAEQFLTDDSCYIHIEMLDGNMDNYVAGDPLAMLYAIMVTINQISFDTDNEFERAMEVIEAMHDDFVDEVMG